jgi:hypothetical protein
MIIESSRLWNYSVKWADSCDVDQAHNLAVATAIHDNADWLIIMGRDNFADAKQLVEMVNTGIKNNYAIIGAPCKHRNEESLNVVIDGKAVKAINVREVVEVEKIGSGIMAINLSWLKDNWPYKNGPWFGSKYYENCVRESQDYVFCDDIRKLGGKIYCDNRVDSGHDTQLALS